jgi:hypothetical protein
VIREDSLAQPGSGTATLAQPAGGGLPLFGRLADRVVVFRAGGFIVVSYGVYATAVSAAMALAGLALLPLVLILDTSAPTVSITEGIKQTATILPLLLVCSLLIFIGLAVQRHRVGEW